MAKEYIEREALKQRLGDLHFQNYGNAILAVMEAPAADVVEVVRCRDCKWCTEKDELTKSGHCDCVHRDVFVESHDGFEAVSFDDFCSYGVRRDEDGNKENL